MSQNRMLKFCLCCLLSTFFFHGLSYILFLNITDSLPLGLYLRVPAKDFKRGDYIVYEPSDEVRKLVRDYGWGDGNHTFMKQIGAVTGDRYAISEETKEFRIMGKHHGRVYDTDTQGHPLPKLRGVFTVPRGHVLPVATNPRSFDGRYTGTIPVDCIKAKVLPIWTE